MAQGLIIDPSPALLSQACPQVWGPEVGGGTQAVPGHRCPEAIYEKEEEGFELEWLRKPQTQFILIQRYCCTGGALSFEVTGTVLSHFTLFFFFPTAGLL